jgi:hypothetical protein
MHDLRHPSIVHLPSPLAEWIETMSRRVGVPPYRVLGALMERFIEKLPARSRRRLATRLKHSTNETLQ